MRYLINTLATINCLAGGVLAFVGADYLIDVTVALAGIELRALLNPGLFMTLAIGIVPTWLGSVIALRSWRHLRHPDSRTPRNVLGTFVYLTVMAIVVPFTGVSLLTLFLMVGLYALQRVIIDRYIAPDVTRPDTQTPTSAT